MWYDMRWFHLIWHYVTWYDNVSMIWALEYTAKKKNNPEQLYKSHTWKPWRPKVLREKRGGWGRVGGDGAGAFYSWKTISNFKHFRMIWCNYTSCMKITMHNNSEHIEIDNDIIISYTIANSVSGRDVAVFGGSARGQLLHLDNWQGGACLEI